jgi:hypothetical protein
MWGRCPHAELTGVIAVRWQRNAGTIANGRETTIGRRGQPTAG